MLDVQDDTAGTLLSSADVTIQGARALMVLGDAMDAGDVDGDARDNLAWATTPSPPARSLGPEPPTSSCPGP
jgi:hypothetical protein